MTAQQESDLFITSMIADRIEQHGVLLAIKIKNYNFEKKSIAKLRKKGKICTKILTKEMQTF